MHNKKVSQQHKTCRPYNGSLPQVPSVRQHGQVQDQQHGCSPWLPCHQQYHNHCHRRSDVVGGLQPPVLHKASDCLAGPVDLRQYVQICGRQLDWSIAVRQHSMSANDINKHNSQPELINFCSIFTDRWSSIHDNWWGEHIMSKLTMTSTDTLQRTLY